MIRGSRAGSSSPTVPAAAAHRANTGLNVVRGVVVKLRPVLGPCGPLAFRLAAGREIAGPQGAGCEVGAAVSGQ